jgi:hypothetical protein
MGVSVRLRVLLVVAHTGLAALAPFACAESDTFVDENPPATGAGAGGLPFDPGDGPPPTSGTGTGTAVGSGGASTTASSTTGAGGNGGSDQPPQCEDALKLCAHTFSHPSGPQSVELRGSFAADGWTNGTPLALVGGTWQVELQLPWNVPVEYKFVLDGTTWVTDPGNPNQVDDGLGGKNSYLAGMTCAEWTCAE